MHLQIILAESNDMIDRKLTCQEDFVRKNIFRN